MKADWCGAVYLTAESRLWFHYSCSLDTAALDPFLRDLVILLMQRRCVLSTVSTAMYATSIYDITTGSVYNFNDLPCPLFSVMSNKWYKPGPYLAKL